MLQPTLSHLDLLASAWIHRFDPVILPIYGDFAIRWYGLAYAAGFVSAFLAARWLARRGAFRIPPERVGDYLVAVILGVVLGGRLGWVAFYSPATLLTFTADPPWWEVLAINRGGMSSHGGMIGVITALALFSRREGVPILHTLDMSALVTPFGLFFGRLANFINGELRGKPCPPDFPLAVKFPQEIAETWPPGRVAELAEIAPELGMTRTGYLEIVETWSASPEDPVARRAYGEVLDLLLAAVRDGSQPVLDLVTPMLEPRYPSQLFQAAAEGLLLLLILWAVWAVLRPRRPGFIGCAFLVFYGLLRILTEVWREPDEGIELVLGLSRGQWLSVLMVVVGLVAAGIIAARVSPLPPTESPNT